MKFFKDSENARMFAPSNAVFKSARTHVLCPREFIVSHCSAEHENVFYMHQILLQKPLERRGLKARATSRRARLENM